MDQSEATGGFWAEMKCDTKRARNTAAWQAFLIQKPVSEAKLLLGEAQCGQRSEQPMVKPKKQHDSLGRLIGPGSNLVPRTTPKARGTRLLPGPMSLPSESCCRGFMKYVMWKLERGRKKRHEAINKHMANEYRQRLNDVEKVSRIDYRADIY